MESSPSSVNDGFLSSPRNQRRLLWGSGGVFAIGLIVFLSVFVLRGSPGVQSPISTLPGADDEEAGQGAAGAGGLQGREDVHRDGRRCRKNLDAAYPIVNQEIKGGLSKRGEIEGLGNIPVIGYPADNSKRRAFTVLWSYKTQLMTIVDLVATKGSRASQPHLPSSSASFETTTSRTASGS